MVGIGAPAIAGLAVGIAFVTLFSTTFQTTSLVACPDSHISSPQMRLSVDGQEFVASEGTLGGRCIEPVFDYVPIIDIGSISAGSAITLSVENYTQPDSVKITIQNSGVYEKELSETRGSTILVPDDIPSGRYGLIVQAKWSDVDAPFDTATYFFHATIG